MHMHLGGYVTQDLHERSSGPPAVLAIVYTKTRSTILRFFKGSLAYACNTTVPW